MSQLAQIIVAATIAALLVAYGLALQHRMEEIRLAKHRDLIACEVRRDSVFLCDKLRQELLAVSLPPPP